MKLSNLFIIYQLCLVSVIANTVWQTNWCKEDEKLKSCWTEMQKYYKQVAYLSGSLTKDGLITQTYRDNINAMHTLINNAPRKDFLTNSCLSGIMVRNGWPENCNYEECFLKNCITKTTANKIKNFTSSTSNNDQLFLSTTSKNFNCSTSTLGHLFYVGKLYDWMPEEPKLIVELGGGYGNLARCFKSVSPDATIVVIDLPEMCAIQLMFLKYTLPNVKIIAHTAAPKQIDPGTINLIPVQFMENIDYLKCDAFVSTFAISEAPEKVQKQIAKLNFFNAKSIYLAGQIDGWSKLGFKDWVHHDVLITSVKNNYKQIYCAPFHIYNPKYESYELLAKN
ncbi:MAG TPA: putative sugar O-methyltransferase [Candidatus Babeliales bacterium]|nr:putative sugar O-methyltransferase [Candidatus Babeliales bacterium]